MESKDRNKVRDGIWSDPKFCYNVQSAAKFNIFIENVQRVSKAMLRIL